MKTQLLQNFKGILFTMVFISLLSLTGLMRAQELPPMPNLEALKASAPTLTSVSNYDGVFILTPSQSGSSSTAPFSPFISFGFNSGASDNYNIGYISGTTFEDFPLIPTPFTSLNRLSVKRKANTTGFTVFSNWTRDIRAQTKQTFEIDVLKPSAVTSITLTFSGTDIYNGADVVTVYTDSNDKSGSTIWQSVNGAALTALSQVASVTDKDFATAATTFFVEFASFADLPPIPGLVTSAQAAVIDNTNDLNTADFLNGVTNIDGFGSGADLAGSIVDRSTGGANDLDNDGSDDSADPDDDGNGIDDQGFGVAIKGGWNLVSTPINLSATALPQTIFGSTAISETENNFAFEWSGSDYVLATDMVPGKGYWIYSDNFNGTTANYNTTYFGDLTGDFSYSESFTLTADAYTLVGGVVANAALSSTDIAAAYAYVNGGYASINGGGGLDDNEIETSGANIILRPGRGYWLLGGGSVGTPSVSVSAGLLENASTRNGALLAKEKIQDAITLIHGNELNIQKLLLNAASDIITPPAPPLSFAATLNGTHLQSASNNAEVVVMSATEDVTLTFTSADLNAKLEVNVDGEIRSLGAGQSTIITNRGSYTFKTAIVKEDIFESELPSDLVLDQNYPNPFNPVTAISYSVNQSMAVQLNVYNMNGQLVTKLVNETQGAGSYTVSFDASRLSSGLYIYRLITPSGIVTKKMTLLK